MSKELTKEDQERITQMGVRLREHAAKGEPLGWVVRNMVHMAAKKDARQLEFFLLDVVVVRRNLTRESEQGLRVMDPRVDAYFECAIETGSALGTVLLEEENLELLKGFLRKNTLAHRVLQHVYGNAAVHVTDLVQALDISIAEADASIDYLASHLLVESRPSDEKNVFYVTTTYGRKALQALGPV